MSFNRSRLLQNLHETTKKDSSSSSDNRSDSLKTLNSAVIMGNRANKLSTINKTAFGDQHGAFQHFQSNVAEYATRERYISQRGGEPVSRDRDSLYGLGPEHEDSYVPDDVVATHLSTRYSPDRVGVQAKRVSDGVFQDPYTNKVYDYNEGFKTEDGREFPPGHAALQTSIMHLANHLDKKGLIKEAAYIDVLLRKNAEGSKTAKRLKTLDDWKGDAAVYELSEPLDGNTHVVVSAVDIDPSSGFTHATGPETMIFGSDSSGNVQDWGDLVNIGELCHTTALKEAGYSMDNSPEDIEVNAPEGVHKGDVESGLIDIANHLDELGLYKEADYLDALINL